MIIIIVLRVREVTVAATATTTDNLTQQRQHEQQQQHAQQQHLSRGTTTTNRGKLFSYFRFLTLSQWCVAHCVRQGNPIVKVQGNLGGGGMVGGCRNLAQVCYAYFISAFCGYAQEVDSLRALRVPFLSLSRSRSPFL